jgi:hypothetical protein
MIYIYYVALVLLSLPMNILALVLAPVLPLFATNSYGWNDNHSKQGFGPRLPTWLNWFMTPDNSLDGDATFELINGRGYLAQVKWLLRNPLYAFAVKYPTIPYYTTVAGDKTIKDNDGAKEGWCFVTANGLFQFRYVKRIGSSNRCVLVNLGWNIMALVDDNVTVKPDVYQATFVFSPRISGFR